VTSMIWAPPLASFLGSGFSSDWAKASLVAEHSFGL